MSIDDVGAAVIAANTGDLFVHRIADWFNCDHPEVILQYIGRSTLGRANCSRELCGNCGKGPHGSPAGRLNFRQVCDNPRGLGRHHGAFRGGLRDAIGLGAWPLCDYFDYDANGTYDERVISLPLTMCAGMLKYDHSDDDEEEKDEP